MGFFGCEVSDDNDDSPNTSYNCTDNDCFSADGGSGQYATLDDCLSVCENNNGGENNTELCWEVDVTSNFDATYHWGEDSGVNPSSTETFYLTGDNTSATFYPLCSYTLSILNTWYYELRLFNESGENGCVEIEVRTYGNDILIQTDNIIFGCVSGAIGSGCDDYCSTYGNELSIAISY